LVQKKNGISSGSRNLALYMGNHVGFLGGIVELTDVPGILRWDCLATDWFHSPSLPTWLFYNPYAEPKPVRFEVGPTPVDLYDVVRHEFVRRGAQADVRLTLPGRTAAVLVVAPAGGKITRRTDQTLIDGIVVDFGSCGR
jgi:hypothetical protein